MGYEEFAYETVEAIVNTLMKKFSMRRESIWNISSTLFNFVVDDERKKSDARTEENK